MAGRDGSKAARTSEPDERTVLIPKHVENNEPGQTRAQDVEEASGEQTLVSQEEWSTARISVTLGSAFLGVFLAAMDSTIVATLSSPISSEFKSSTLLSWLASGYLIANAGFQPISGKLSDIFGRRSCLVVANIFFAVGNLICGLAREEWVFILGRVVSGIGGGCMNTISTFAASDLVPLRRRGLWQGIGNICFGVGSGVGGVIGGLMNDTIGWRWAFLLQVPLVVVSTLIVGFTMKIPVKESNTSKVKRIDFLGATTLVAALVLLLLGLNSGGNIVSWSHPLVYVTLPLSGVLLLLFLYIEEKVAVEPVIPVRLLLNRTVASACLVNWTLSMAYYSILYYGPVFFQVKGLSAFQAGVRLIPNSIGIMVGSFGSGYIMKATGRYYYLSMGTQASFILACALILGLFHINTPTWLPFLAFFFGGVGYGSMLTITLLALISAVPHEYQAVITSASYAARSTGSTIGITVASAVFQNLLMKYLWNELGDTLNAAKLIQKLRADTNALKLLHGSIEMHALIAYMEALRGVWITMFALSIVGAVAALFMRENTLYNNLERK